ALAPEDDLASLYGPASEPWYEIAPEDREIAAQEVAELNRRNYLYAAVHYRIDDFTRISFSCAVSLDDLSFLPALVVELEPFQALTLSVSCRVPLDRHSLGRLGARGELGPDNAGSRASMTVSARLRF
ncbi:MAG TPA: hypothetical protein VLH39_03865, partial [Magnetospirillaceae bacterium]|nr:hypothetical protein [Magnetospirillaceae bacterium]